MSKTLLALLISLPLMAASKGPLPAKDLQAKQNAAFCKIPNIPEKMRKAHGCK